MNDSTYITSSVANPMIMKKIYNKLNSKDIKPLS